MSETPAAVFQAPVTNAYVADRIYTSSSMIRSIALDQEEIKRQQAMFVPTAVMEALTERLKTYGVVALVGPKGSGRRITAINLLAGLGLQPREVPLDEDDAGELLGPPDMGYIVHADDLAGSSKPLQACIGSARERGLPIVIRVASNVWRRVAVDGVPELPIASAPAIDIFARHLTVSLGEIKASGWSAHPKIKECLSPAGPRDAVRLAGLAAEAMSKAGHFSEHLVDEVLGAYTNWEAELEHIFSAVPGETEDEEGRTRALWLAAAVLEGSTSSSVFTAARTLSEILELRPEAGHGLVGPSTRKRLESISAHNDDGRVVFSRTAFGASTLDFVWSHWPQLHKDLQDWFGKLAQQLPEDGPLIAERVADLAIRQRHFAMLNTLATGFLEGTATFGLGVALLTRAAMSDELGRAARRALYQWSRQSPPRHPAAVVATCTGPLAEAFPRVALTRLKHVALTAVTDVRKNLVDGLTSLATNLQLRRELLDELVRWLDRSEPESRRIVAAEALLKVLLLQDPDGRLLLLEHPDPGWEPALAVAWRSLLRSPLPEAEIRSGVSYWLEAAAQARAPLSTVVTVLGEVPSSAVEESLLVIAVFRWARETSDEAEAPRQHVFHQVIDAVLAGSGTSTRESIDLALQMEQEARADD
ncbi:hypothetical protein ACIBK9_51420 [Nonomuraea sp. NPDC050227]|uniref:hypothetical protein n=1 Tax=Nonomuraea sp. NPDC050227 TaxID=3364360 RepID=UPI00379A43A5